MSKFQPIVDFIRIQFPKQNLIPLHEPRFMGNEKKYVVDAIESNYVSSIGPYVNRFEEMMTKLTGSKYAIATVNGTSAIHVALLVSGVTREDEVLTQALTFIAGTNAIAYTGARPVFIDVNEETMGMSPLALSSFLKSKIEMRKGVPHNKATKKRIAACLPMHTFGFPCEIETLTQLCQEWNIPLIEDAAESLGSSYKGKHTGTFGQSGVFSFNGNKTVTCGGGGAIITNDERLARHAKHLTTQAKLEHAWEFNHDQIGFNYRMPNLNAALACAQLEQLDGFVVSKRELARRYADFFQKTSIVFKREPKHCRANYWLNAIQLESRTERDEFLQFTNSHGITTRPVWSLMNTLPMFQDCQDDGLKTSVFLADRLVNLPSSVSILA